MRNGVGSLKMGLLHYKWVEMGWLHYKWGGFIRNRVASLKMGWLN